MILGAKSGTSLTSVGGTDGNRIDEVCFESTQLNSSAGFLSMKDGRLAEVKKKKNKNEKTKNCSLLCRNSLKGVESRVTTFEGIN